MRLAIMLEGQEGLSYDTILAVAKRTEAAGLYGLFRSDHYSSVAGRESLESTDAWATLAGLARETERIQLGPLVSPVTFRPPAVVAKMAATVGEMAGPAADGSARVTLGMGTGWLEVEHRRHGFPFEDLDTRFRRLEEHLQIITSLWDPWAQPFDFDGEFATLRDARFLPVPSPRIPVTIGGSGMRRTPSLVARYADELNGVFLTPERCAEQRVALRQACELVGRDPDSAGYTLMTGAVVGATDADFRARVRTLQQLTGDGSSLDEFVARRRGTWILGTVDQAREHLGALAAAGVEGVMLQHLNPGDLEMIDVVAEELAA